MLVLRTVNGATITAGQVIVQPPGGGSAPSTAAAVVPFQRGARSTSKQVGQIPSSYRQGSGTIVSGTTASKATEAALSAFPGGIVDRVVKLSNGVGRTGAKGALVNLASPTDKAALVSAINDAE